MRIPRCTQVWSIQNWTINIRKKIRRSDYNHRRSEEHAIVLILFVEAVWFATTTNFGYGLVLDSWPMKRVSCTDYIKWMLCSAMCLETGKKCWIILVCSCYIIAEADCMKPAYQWIMFYELFLIFVPNFYLFISFLCKPTLVTISCLIQ